MSVVWQQSTHGVPRRREQVNRVTAMAFVAAITIITILAFAYLALAASSARLSAEIWRTHMEMGEIRRECSRLETEIARLSSIPVLQTRSRKLGYVPANVIEFIEVEGP
jgi:cell division protein FtsB